MPLTICDSIAIKILSKNALLAGVGNELHLHTGNDALTTQCQTLALKLRGKVHGIESSSTATNSGQLLVYGEKEFMLLQETNAAHHDYKLLCRGHLSDWISAATILDESNHFVLLTAHSIALHFEYVPEKHCCRIVERASCSDKSTLYCATLHGAHWKELVIFGGNAFGELLIWQPTACKTELLQRISAHNGVIFSIDYDAQAQLLTTTSDDRSIRFWRVQQEQSKQRLLECDWRRVQLLPLTSGYGHVARVFQGRLITYAGQTFAISVGEDSYICVWRSNGELLHKRRQQFGATIWNFDYATESQTLYTVGSTGNVLAYGLQQILEQATTTITSLTNAAGSIVLPAIAPDTYMARIKFLTANALVGITQRNELLYKQLTDDDDNVFNADWQPITQFAGYKCSVLELKYNTLAVGGYKRLTLFRFCAESRQFEKLYDETLLSGILRACKFLSATQLLIADDKGDCLLLQLNTPQQQQQHIELPRCKEPWPTAAVLIDKQHLVLSTRLGHILSYVWQPEHECFKHCDTLKQPHGHLGATLIKLLQIKAQTALLQSAGHDGSLKELLLTKQSGQLRIVRRQLVPVAWVEALVVEKHNDDEQPPLCLGFNDNHFVAWSTQHDFTLQLSCGGGHRCWDYSIYRNEKGIQMISLVFVRNKQLLLHTTPLFNSAPSALNSRTRNHWHVRPCNVLECIDSSADVSIIISAGDDNLIKISKYARENDAATLQQICEVQTHISNIRALKVLQLDAENQLLITGGGRAQLCVTRFNVQTLQLEELLSYTLKTSDSSATQRSENVYNLAPETRIMSLDVLTLSTTLFHIFVGCSDGFLRKYQLNIDDATSHCVIEPLTDIYYGRCILQVRLVEAHQLLLIAATDGILRFVNLSLTQQLLELMHHASGINALDMRYVAETQQLQLLTGGDDQQLVYSQLSLVVADAPPRVLDTVHFSHLHTAQVTAAQLSRCGRYAYSCGVDQQLYKLQLDTQQVIAEFYSCVADIKGLRLCKEERYCLLYGCGLQICELQS